MSTFWSRHWFKVVTLLLIVAIGGTFAYKALAKKGSPYGIQKAAPEFRLDDLNGKQVSLADTSGKVRLLYFFWSTCPDVCGPTTYILSQVQNGLKEKGVFGKEAAFISISFDPARDTPEQLKKFANGYKADLSGWSFLRGDEKTTQDLAEKYGISIIKEKDGSFSHSNAIFLIDGKGNIRNYYSGSATDLDTKKIVNDVMVMTNEL